MNTGPFFIRLQHADGRLPVCASKFWGNPDLPEDVDYPMAYYPDTDSYEPYHFICQINLADLPPQDILPRRGLLQFYANIHYYLGWDCDVEISGYPSGADMVKVLYFPDPDPVSFRTVVVVGDDESDVLFPHEMAMSFDGSLRDDEPCIHLLGEPEFREWEEWDEPCRGWRVLLQVDSFDGDDFNLNFMDCGVLDFLISDAALRRLDFSDVRGIVLST